MSKLIVLVSVALFTFVMACSQTVPASFDINKVHCRAEDLQSIYGRNLLLGSNLSAWDPSVRPLDNQKFSHWQYFDTLPILSCTTFIYGTVAKAKNALDYDTASERIELMRHKYEFIGEHIGVVRINRVEAPEIGEESLALEVLEYTGPADRHAYYQLRYPFSSASTIVIFRRMNVVVMIESYRRNVSTHPPIDEPSRVARIVDRLLKREIDRVSTAD